MDIKNWQNIETIFHAALELRGKERQNYVNSVCQGNDKLMREIASLISAFDEDSAFMDEPVFTIGMQVLEEKNEKSLAGQKISFYEIGRKIGSGGMGDVYLAEDTRLNRKVALKFLSNSLISDEWGRKQLIREAQAIAMIDHPNICTVHGIEKTDEFQFIVMQYIQGETLSYFINQKAIKPEQILPITLQIVDALAAAHSYGIIHRDIKPGNIMVMSNGQVKVLDFGLAKIIPQNKTVQKNGNGQNSQKGLILGTVAYMSPEQLRAEDLDYRSDVFSLGILLAELSSFKHPFACDSDAETISAVLKSQVRYQPDKSLKLPAGFDRLIKKCLKKDKEERYPSARELYSDLQNLEKKNRTVRFQAIYFRSILIFLLSLSIFFAFYIYQKAIRVRTLAVFPFVNESSDRAFDYLENGMAEDFINRISGSDKLQVKAFTVVSGYKTKEIDPVKEGHTLNVDAVLLGKINRVNNQLVLHTKLIDTTDGTQIWEAENIIQDSDILALQVDISRRIINRLQPWGSTPAQSDNGYVKQTDDPEAFNLYWKGRYFWQMRGDKENIPKAIGFFNRAIEIDPAYTKAYAGLADSYALQSQVAYGSTEQREASVKAKAAAKKAVEIGSQSCEAHTSLGVVLFKLDWNWTEAGKEFQQAIELNPEYAPAHYWYSVLLSHLGRFDEALAEGEKARELDPFSQVSQINIARIYYYTQRYDEALQTLSAKDEPASERKLNIRYMVGLIYIRKKMYAEAIEIFREIYAADKSAGGALLGYCYAKIGKKQDALDILAEREKSQEYFPPTEKVFIYIGLNDKKKALEYLKTAVREKYSSLVSLKVEPLYEDLRSEPEYAELIKQMSF